MLDFAIIGAQKAATSTLHSALREIDDIYMPVDESPFFEFPEYTNRPWEEFNPFGSSKLGGIKRPNYLCSPEAPSRVFSACPDVRLIVVLRDPISRAVSALFHLMRHGHVPLTGLNEGIASSLRDISRGINSQSSTVVTHGLYGAGLERWTNFFPPERLLVLDDTSVSSDLASTVQACCQHLEMAPTSVTLDGNQKKNQGIYNQRLLQLARYGHLLKSQRLSSERRIAKRIGPSLILGHSITQTASWLGRYTTYRPKLDPALRSELVAIYQADRKVLGRFIQLKSLSWDIEPEVNV